MPKLARQSSPLAPDQFDDFGELLRHLRRQAGLTQRDLGQAVGYSEAQITRLERGQRLPDLAAVEALFIDALRANREPQMAERLVLLAEATQRKANARVRYPADASIQTKQTNLPAQLTRFFGRERELAECHALLSATRLLSFIGPGGVGKSRLAQEAARTSEDFADGIWLVELAFATQPEQVAYEIAGALGLKMQAHRSARDLICDFIHDRHMLLILDNCEHLVATCAELAQGCLQRCRHLRILATSREVLRAPGETVHRVQPLALPPASATAHDIGTLAHYSAITLFVHRARAAQPEFALTAHNAPAIAQVCRRLDGIPLAIELAAAQVKALSVEQLAMQLEQGLHLHLGSIRAALSQHQTLHATLDWSHSLLSVEEQVLFRRLSIFNGPFTLEMAETVCAGVPLHADVFVVLPQLIDKSLIVSIQVGDDMRYRLLDTIREYGQVKLNQSGELPALQRALFAWAVAFGESTAAQINSREKAFALSEMALAHDNLVTALQWQLARDAAGALRLCVAMAPYWHIAGVWLEGRRCLETGLRPTRDAAPSALQAAGLYWLSRIYRRLNDWAAALRHAQESVAMYHALGDERGLADAMLALGWATYSHIGHAEAAAHFEAGLALYRRLNDARGIAQSLLDLSRIVTETSGDHERATRLLAESRNLFEQLNDDEGAALVCTTLAYIATLQADYVLCRDLLLEGLIRFQRIGAKGFVAGQYLELGEVYFYLGDLVAAEDALQKSLVIHRELGSWGGTARTLHHLAYLRFDAGQWQDAKALLKEALTQFQILQCNVMSAHCVALLGCIACEMGSFALATRLLAAAQCGFESEFSPITPADQAEYDHLAATCRVALGDSAFAEAWAAGQSLSLDEACAEAMTI